MSPKPKKPKPTDRTPQRAHESPPKPAGATAAMLRESWVPAFLSALAETGNVYRSCQRAGVARSTVYDRKASDESFRVEYESALNDACDLLEEEARRRAYAGTEKPVYQGGQLVGHIQEFSDTLMVVLLKAHRPEKYRERVDARHSGPDGGPLQVQTVYDLSKLTDAQLDALESLAGTGGAEPGSDPG